MAPSVLPELAEALLEQLSASLPLKPGDELSGIQSYTPGQVQLCGAQAGSA